MTSRRDFLKTGALVAAPVAVMAPAAAIAGEDGAGRLARLEDEREIAQLMRDFLARFNRAGASHCRHFCAHDGAWQIAADVAAILPDPATGPALEFAGDHPAGQWAARWQQPALIECAHPFAGETTLEQMARFQGQPMARSQARGQIEAQFARPRARRGLWGQRDQGQSDQGQFDQGQSDQGGWLITRIMIG